VAAGYALSVRRPVAGVPLGRWIVAAGAVAIAAAGVLASLGAPRRPAAAPDKPFPWTGPVHTFMEFLAIRKDRLLVVVVIANVTAWFAGSLLIQFVNLLATTQLGTTADEGASPRAGFSAAGWPTAGPGTGPSRPGCSSWAPCSC